VAELVDAPDLGSDAARRAGSSPASRTILFSLGSHRLSFPSDGVTGATRAAADGSAYRGSQTSVKNL